MIAMCWGKVCVVCKVKNLILYQLVRARYRRSLKSKALHYLMEMTNLMLFIHQIRLRQVVKKHLLNTHIKVIAVLLEQRMLFGFF